MAISKVTLNGTTLMDVTTATAAAGDVIAPKTAMLKNGVVTTGTGTAPTGTKQISITQNGTTTEDVATYANAEITVNVQVGTPIGVQSPKESILGMMYALEHGDAKTGTFTLAQTLPNVETEVFDANDSSVLCFAIFQEGAGIDQTKGNNANIENIFWMHDGTKGYSWSLADTQIENTSMSLSLISDPQNNDIRYATWSFVNGVLKCTARYNHNSQYTPFRAGVTYRWVAW